MARSAPWATASCMLSSVAPPAARIDAMSLRFGFTLVLNVPCTSTFTTVTRISHSFNVCNSGCVIIVKHVRSKVAHPQTMEGTMTEALCPHAPVQGRALRHKTAPLLQFIRILQAQPFVMAHGTSHDESNCQLPPKVPAKMLETCKCQC